MAFLEVKNLKKQFGAVRVLHGIDFSMEKGEVIATLYTDKEATLDSVEKEFLKMKNPSRALVSSLIDRIEIDEDNNVDIYYKFKLI